MISIISGTCRGKKLKVPEGKQVRPTANKVREAVFNVLNQFGPLNQYVVLDLYAGSGALGLEALSRGAKKAFFIENDYSVYEILKRNVKDCKVLDSQGCTVQNKAERWLAYFDNDHPCLIFVDPPYHQGEYEKILPLLAKLPSIPNESIVVVESPTTLLYHIAPSFEVIKTKIYGTVHVNFLLKE
ncbi:16S rRNA (guanine(966)-N(2))-methyltransferase RsmD [Deltaproteobacteria bacterium TL4]